MLLHEFRLPSLLYISRYSTFAKITTRFLFFSCNELTNMLKTVCYVKKYKNPGKTEAESRKGLLTLVMLFR